MSAKLEHLKSLMGKDISENRAILVLEFLKTLSKHERNWLAEQIGVWLTPFLIKPKKRAIKTWTREELNLRIEKSGKKHYFIPDQQSYEVIEEDPVRTVNWALALKIFKEAKKDNLLKKYRMYERLHDIKILKNLSDYVKIGGPRVEKDWMLLVNCDTLWGWGEKADNVTINEYIKGWTSVPYQPWWKGEINDPAYYREFETAVKKMLNAHRNDDLPNDLSLEVFLDAIPLMGTSGSGYNPVDKATMEVEYEGEKLKIANNKYRMAASMSMEKKKKRMFELRPQKAKVSQKLELYPKMRLIVSGEFWLSMKMRWIRTWLDKWLNGSGWSTLWSTKEQTWQMWNKSCDMTSGVKCPLDQAKFDWHANKTQLNLILEGIKQIITLHAKDLEMITVMDSIIFAMKSGEIIFEDEKYAWNSGILSGWDWTALLDTMLNYTEYLMAVKVANEYAETTINWINVQGDDQNIETADWSSTLSYWAAMESMNIDVHPSKNFFSQVHNEYLRKGMDKSGMNGYPLRMINSMCWHYPESPFERDPLEKLKNLWSNWEKLGERMNIDLTKYFIKDATKAKIPKAQISDYVHMSRIRGGAGIEPLNNLMFKIEGGNWLKKPEIINAPGYKDFQLRFGEYQSRELENWMLGAVGTPDFTKSGKELKFERTIETVEGPTIKPKAFIFLKGVKMTRPTKIVGYPDQVIMGSNDDLMRKIFPNIDLFVDQGRAPKRWIYDYLVGKVKDTTPKIKNLSTEMSSLLWSIYSPSMYNAMYVQKTTPDKWESLNTYAQNNFERFVVQHRLARYRMVG